MNYECKLMCDRDVDVEFIFHEKKISDIQKQNVFLDVICTRKQQRIIE